MAKQVWKGGALLAPLPAVLITSGDMENSNIATVAWTGIVNTIPPKTYISLRKSRYSYEIIEKTGEFAINLTTADYCGIYTGRKVDKFKKCNFTKEAASQIASPIIGESPLALECRVIETKDLGTHVMMLADILATNVDEKLLDKDGRMDLGRANLIAFAHGEYFALGKKLSGFGDSAKKKKRKNTARDSSQNN